MAGDKGHFATSRVNLFIDRFVPERHFGPLERIFRHQFRAVKDLVNVFTAYGRLDDHVAIVSDSRNHRFRVKRYILRRKLIPGQNVEVVAVPFNPFLFLSTQLLQLQNDSYPSILEHPIGSERDES